MRNVLQRALILMSMLAFCVGCGDDGGGDGGGGGGGEDNPLITGEAYILFDADDVAVTLGPDELDTMYFMGKDETDLIGPAGGNAFMAQIPGGAPGTFTTADGLFATYETDPTQGFPWGYVAGKVYEGSSFTIEITEYQEIGGWITGTFSGTMVEMHDTDPTGETVEITGGAFALIRGNDRD